jgi:nucleoside-diphosphate-sugar epimerase
MSLNMTRPCPRSEAELDDRLSEPPADVVELLARLGGDFVLLGAAGKMGPSLARMVKRAVGGRRVVAVSRFTGGGEDLFRDHGIETARCDLLDEAAVAGLPDAANVIAMTGRKFGSTGDEPATWAMNAYLPAVVCKKYRRSRIVAFSTGNVYPFVLAAGGGSREADPPAPVGEYGMSALGRERMYDYFARTLNIPTAIIRLNYACDLRYGVLVDLARKVWEGRPVELAMGYFNTIWQGDANAQTLRAFAYVGVPAWVVNVTGPEVLSVRAVCEEFGRRTGKTVRFVGDEAATALLSNTDKAQAFWGRPGVSTEALTGWVVEWVMAGGRLLGKPTHFEARDGRF